MRSLINIILCSLILLVGCNADSLELDDRWAPLELITERPDMLASADVVTTIGHTMYVEDLDRWLLTHPIDSPRFNATLLHERVHSVRQLDMGVTEWLARYVTDTDFMWDEESRGWYETLREWQRTRVQFSPEGVAQTLANYRNIAGPMISYQEALTWIRDVLNGWWEPAN